jgi:hypothetical protein
MGFIMTPNRQAISFLTHLMDEIFHSSNSLNKGTWARPAGGLGRCRASPQPPRGPGPGPVGIPRDLGQARGGGLRRCPASPQPPRGPGPGPVGARLSIADTE